MRYFIFFILFVSPFLSWRTLAQKSALVDCVFSIKGIVMDKDERRGIEGVNISIEGSKFGAVSDAQGKFEILKLCKGNYTLSFSILSHQKYTQTIDLQENVAIEIRLVPTEYVLDEVSITSEKLPEMATQAFSELKGTELAQTKGLPLGEALKNITGVSAIQTGATISKPVIHGLHSNRILILNNGVRLEGQQWGSEHAPEIDPFVANNLSVIKGAAGIRYGADAIGGVIMLNPKPMPTSKNVHAEISVVGMTNGQLGATSAMLEKGFDKKWAGLSLRVQGTLKTAGNFKTSDYYLENTGLRERNFSTTIAYQKEKFGLELFYSRFYTQIGMFTGALISNLSDMQLALQQAKPNTPSYFSHAIARPYQSIQHQLLKIAGHRQLRNAGKLTFNYALQNNQRTENDRVPLFRPQDPELYLEVTTQTAEVLWDKPIKEKIKSQVGLSFITQGNVRRFAFLIPNFRNYGGGVFWLGKLVQKQFTFEAGLRYDYRWLRAFLQNIDKQIITPTFDFHNLTGSAGVLYQWNKNLSLAAHWGTAWRPPTVNELLSNGVHQSAASFEKGNQQLTAEQAYNFNFSTNYNGKKWFLDIDFYQNFINHFIFLQPDLQVLQTIRGAFPSFSYTQANVVFRGMDAHLKYYLHENLTFSAKYSLISAYNKTIDDYLIFTPSNRAENGLKYAREQLLFTKNFYLGFSSLYVAQQRNVPQNSDYTAPPPAYHLINLDLGFDLALAKQTLNVHFQINNVGNVAYREYLNRYRYFADDLGRNFVMRLLYKI